MPAGPPVIVLGAGHGRRMGGPKAFARAGGRTFLERILERCRESASPVTLTVDPAFRGRVETLLAELPGPPPRLVACDGARPMLASVQAALGSGVFSGGFWLWPVDAPFLSAAGWARAVAAARAAPDAVWKLRVAGHTGHPVWFPGWAVPAIRTGDWPDGLLGFLRAHPGAVRVLSLEGEVVADVNTPDQLAALTGE